MKKYISLLLVFALLMIFSIQCLAVDVQPMAVAMSEQITAHNTFTTSQRIYQDYTLSGRITTTTEIDYYIVTFETAGKINFWMGDIPSGCDYDLYIYNSSQSLVASSTGTTSQESVINYSVSANSTYYIKVISYSGYSTTGYYLLRCKWYPSNGFTYYYNKNPDSTTRIFFYNKYEQSN